ncbi:MAG: RcnB family protein [Proteobacteria bacterium]|nr:RcnB family protein [Pseudomonadota bacterium]MBU0965148.1 RcnB family protein [Pseudomonadota bacterium]
MRKITLQKNRILALALAGILATAAPALAEKPSWAGGGKKDNKHEQSEKYDKEKHDDRGDHDYRDGRDGHDDHHQGVTPNIYFGDPQRTAVHSYYREQFRSGHCPPGLAKKKNGCMPPGHAKKWKKGKQLPRDVIFYDLPPEVIVQLGPPPEHHRFVRVANDILLIAVGTGMVVDAIQDLSDY